MSYKLELSERFQREAKRILKKYPSFEQEFYNLRNSLLETSIQGTPIGGSCDKIRLSIASKARENPAEQELSLMCMLPVRRLFTFNF